MQKMHGMQKLASLTGVSMSKYTVEQKMRDSHWNRKMWKAVNNNFEPFLSSIENRYLRIKTACIIYWDSTDGSLLHDRDFTYLKSISDTYRPYMEKHVSYDDLRTQLINVGYPDKLASKRATAPKGWNHEFYRRLRKRTDAKETDAS